MEKVKFYLPLSLRAGWLDLIEKFLDLKEQHSNWFKDFEIGAVYGCFVEQKWNGGRSVKVWNQEIDSRNHELELINKLNELGIPFRFTYTNQRLIEDDLYDEMCNNITAQAENGMNGIIVNSSLLEQYLRQNYPNYKYISSTTKLRHTIDEFNELTKQYDMAVVDFRDAKTPGYLDAIADKSKAEIIINSVCDLKCTRCKAHYDIMSDLQLAESIDEFKKINEKADKICPYYTNEYDIKGIENNKSLATFTKKEVWKKLVPMGFTNFKLRGRGFSIVEYATMLARYLAKDGYELQVLQELLDTIW